MIPADFWRPNPPEKSKSARNLARKMNLQRPGFRRPNPSEIRRKCRKCKFRRISDGFGRQNCLSVCSARKRLISLGSFLYFAIHKFIMAVNFEIGSTSSSSSTVDPRYDVFLSFRGFDTRPSFTDHLYKALVDANIITFLDEEEIETGLPLKPELETAIKASRASIIVLSQNYASSTWCFDELVLILEQRRNRNHFVIPIFYHVEPTDIRKQQNSFGEAMAKHHKRMETDTDPKKRNQWAQNIGQWSEALSKVAGLKGEVAKGRPKILTGAAVTAETVAPKTTYHSALTITNIRNLVPLVLDLEKVQYTSWASLFCNTAKATISVDLLHTILDDTTTAMTAWTHLQQIFQDNKSTWAVHLENQFSTIRQESFSSISAYCQQLKTVADQLASIAVTKAKTGVGTLTEDMAVVMDPIVTNSNHGHLGHGTAKGGYPLCPYPSIPNRQPSAGILGPPPSQPNNSPHAIFTKVPMQQPTDLSALFNNLSIQQPDPIWYMDTGASSHLMNESGNRLPSEQQRDQSRVSRSVSTPNLELLCQIPIQHAAKASKLQCFPVELIRFGAPMPNSYATRG
ncbi:hypothetical protein OSB04_013237 [Centaurea solstitialis]|uniref:TIR domain-containing protein n=1 Tax=Centaurea solstitialis TaxID=347529 RepID=A0AA38TXL5_9ASTR|nr:hypothetical protein OSB04_013237 [Centaurea solstitialis]